MSGRKAKELPQPMRGRISPRPDLTAPADSRCDYYHTHPCGLHRSSIYRSMSDAGQQVEELEGADALPPPPLPSRQAAFKGEHWE